MEDDILQPYQAIVDEASGRLRFGSRSMVRLTITCETDRATVYSSEELLRFVETRLNRETSFRCGEGLVTMEWTAQALAYARNRPVSRVTMIREGRVWTFADEGANNWMQVLSVIADLDGARFVGQFVSEEEGDKRVAKIWVQKN